MSSILIVSLMLGVVAVIYAAAAGGYLSLGRPGMCLTFVGYVLANIGLIWDVIQTGRH